MLSADLRVTGFTQHDWRRLGELLQREAAGPTGGVVAVQDGARLIKLWHTRQGRLPVVPEPWPAAPDDLVRRHGVAWAAVLDHGALDTLSERVGERLRREHDATAQARLIVTVLAELEQEGLISVAPRPIASWPRPSDVTVSRALDVLCGDGRSILLGAYEGGELYTSLLLRRRGDAFDLLLGPDDLRRDVGLVSGDWVRDHRHLVRAAERRAGPLGLGCFAERRTLRRLLSAPTAGAWTAAVAARDVVLAPLSPAIAVTLGVDLGWVALEALRGLAGRWSKTDDLAALLGPVWSRAKDLYAEADPASHLGFDPLALLRELLRSRGA